MINTDKGLYSVLPLNFTGNKVDEKLEKPALNPAAILPAIPVVSASTSDFRRVFQTTDQMKDKFAKFLNTIFYQLDEKKVFDLMEKLLNDPSKSDEDIYNELRDQINSTKKTLPVLSKLWSLYVLKKGMGKQVAELLKDFRKDKFEDYLEIYDRRYLKTIRKAAQFPLNGKSIAVCNSPEVGPADRIQAGALLSSYPYKQFEPLNDADCEDPFLYPEKTHKPISDNVADNSIDLIAGLGGLHHIPASRVDAFVDSLHKKLRPGGVILLRDHNVADHDGEDGLAKDDVRAVAAVVHSFVNAEDGVDWQVEKNEIREFKSLDDWTRLMANHGFKRVSNKELVLKDDPTENAMIAFVKAPTTLEELKTAISYRNDNVRPPNGTMATWIEWGNVRFAKQYAEYIQNHHSSGFDYIGHMRQHWQHFYYYLTESLNDPETSLSDLVLSDNMAMNLFILTAATAQCSINGITSLPEQLIGRLNHGENWRDVVSLTELEKFYARYEKDYSSFLDHTPFQKYDYLGKMKEMVGVVINSPESLAVKAVSSISAAISGLAFIGKAIVSAPIKAFYSSEGNEEPAMINMLISDPQNELDVIVEQWEKEKDPQNDLNNKIEVIHETADGHKLVSLPRYKPFTKICGYLSNAQHLEILEIANHKKISVDVLLDEATATPQVEGARVVYEMEKLQDEARRRYVTYMVNVNALKVFERVVGTGNIEYIHD